MTETRVAASYSSYLGAWVGQALSTEIAKDVEAMIKMAAGAPDVDARRLALTETDRRRIRRRSRRMGVRFITVDRRHHRRVYALAGYHATVRMLHTIEPRISVLCAATSGSYVCDLPCGHNGVHSGDDGTSRLEWIVLPKTAQVWMP